MDISTPTAPATAAGAPNAEPESSNPGYWKGRKDSVYLYVARLVCARFGGAPQSVLDVGSNGTPTLEWHRRTASQLVSVDLKKPYRGPGVDAQVADFFAYVPPAPFDLVTCFQVLEHVPDARAFAQKLLACGKVLIVSVPYRWRKGECKWHVHDPVDEDKMRAWFGREPVYSYIASELGGVRRLIQVYGPDEMKPAVWQVPVPAKVDAKSTAPGGTPAARKPAGAAQAAKPQGTKPQGAKPQGAKPQGAKPQGAKPQGAAKRPGGVAARAGGPGRAKARKPAAPPKPPPTLARRAKRLVVRVLRRLHLWPAAPLPAAAAPIALPPPKRLPVNPAGQAPLAERLTDIGLLYPHGYLVGRAGGSVPPHYRAIDFPVPLCVHPRTKIGVARDGSRAIAVIGEALDPQAPGRDHAAVAQAVLAAGERWQAVVDRLIGRFVVVTVAADGGAEIQTDAIGLRSAYFARVDGQVVAGSHARMVAEAAARGPVEMLDLPMKWGYPGIDTPYPGVLRLPPNVALSLRGGGIRRFFPVAEIPQVGFEEAWAFAFEQGSQAIDALSRRSELLVSLTSGLDSRCTLAASREQWGQLRFFTYIDALGSTRGDHEIDSAVAADMASVLGLAHETFPYGKAGGDDALLAEALDANVFGNHAKRLAAVYLRRFGDQNLVHVRTNLLELARSNLYAKSRKSRQMLGGPRDAQSMARFYGSLWNLSRRDHILPAFERYVAECDVATALRFASPWDLYFVEHRMGAWQANVCAESDIAFNTVIIFNSREIVRRIMGVPEAVRSSSSHLRERLAQMLPEVAHIPINPEQYTRVTGPRP